MSERKKIAVILSRFPYPLDKGDKLRAFHQIAYIARFHDVYLYALHEEAIREHAMKALQPFCKDIRLYRLNKIEIGLNIVRSFIMQRPVQVGYFYSSRHHKKMTQDIINVKPDTVYCQLSRTAFYGKDLPFRKVIDFQDAFSTNYERMQRTFTGVKKYFYKREGQRMKAFEKNMARWFDEATIISAFDKAKIDISPNRIIVVSNGVDTGYFHSSDASKTCDILFSGNLSYRPNRQAVIYLLEKIAPKLILLKPAIKIKIVGSSGQEFKHFESNNIQISGWVDDIRECYDSAKIFVAPLFTGAGLQNKLLEAMSMGVPCVTTSVTNASLLATENEHVLLANNDDEFVSTIIELLDDTNLQHTLSLNARAFVLENFSWEVANKKLVDLL
jgi:glycosyltransferase involved in cell wall biosynthesis